MLAAFEFAGYDVAARVGRRRARQQARRVDPARRAALAVARLPGPSRARRRVEAAVMTGVLQPGQGWQLVGEGYAFTEAPAVNAKGEVFFADIPKNRVYRVALDGTVSVFKEESGGASGLMFGADGRLYACQTRHQADRGVGDGRARIGARRGDRAERPGRDARGQRLRDRSGAQAGLARHARTAARASSTPGIAQAERRASCRRTRRCSMSPTRPGSSSTPSASRPTAR